MMDVNPNSEQYPDSGSVYPVPPARYEASALLVNDPEYKDLLTRYQNADWESCSRLVKTLSERFPDEPILQDFREDIEVKLIFLKNERDIAIQRKKELRKKTITTILIITAGILAGILAIYLISRNVQTLGAKASLLTGKEREARIVALEEQANNYLRVANTQMAIETIMQIRELDPSYPGLSGLMSQANQLLELSKTYDQAMQLIEDGKTDEGLAVLKEIESINAYFKDVAYQIDKIEKKKSISELLVVGDTAYREKRWKDVIAAYEEILQIDPATETPALEEQLFMSYYETIKNILTAPDNTIDEINTAEIYYRRAISLVPQDKAFSQERKDLQQFLVGLLKLKYRETARAVLETPYLTEETVSVAANYLQKASDLDPDDGLVKVELDKMQIYLTGFQAFDKQDWDTAIANLNRLYEFQNDYSNGLVRHMLYEAYTARGSRFMSAGYFQDARQDFEKAEIIAWEIGSNPLILFESQIHMAQILGKTYDYRNAITYFDMAYDTLHPETNVKDAASLKAIQDARKKAETFRDYATFDAYQKAFSNLGEAYLYKEVKISKGQNLASYAHAYSSSVQAIRAKNDVADVMVLKSDMTVFIPFIP